MGQALRVAERTGGAEGATLAQSARDSFVDAMATTLRVGSLTAIVAAAAVLWMLRSEAGSAAPAPDATAPRAPAPTIPID